MMNTVQDLHMDFGMDLRAFEENQSPYNAERCIRGINRFKEFGDALGLVGGPKHYTVCRVESIILRRFWSCLIQLH